MHEIYVVLNFQFRFLVCWKDKSLQSHISYTELHLLGNSIILTPLSNKKLSVEGSISDQDNTLSFYFPYQLIWVPGHTCQVQALIWCYVLTFFTGQYNLIGYLQSEFSFHLSAHIGWEKSFLTLTNVDLRRGKYIQAVQGQKDDLCFVLDLWWYKIQTLIGASVLSCFWCNWFSSLLIALLLLMHKGQRQ